MSQSLTGGPTWSHSLTALCTHDRLPASQPVFVPTVLMRTHGHCPRPALGRTWSCNASLQTEEMNASCTRDHWPHEGLASSLAQRLSTEVSTEI